MSQVVLYGAPPSTYTRTARMVAEEKGVAYELVTPKLGSDEHLAVHPFGRIPALRHGDFHVYETSAIARYLDESFPGPALVPASPRERAVMEQWISNVNSYLYDDLVKNYLFPYIFPKTADKQPDRALIEKGLPHVKRDLVLLDQALGKSAWLAGKELSLADLFVAPILAYVGNFPEAKEILAGLKNVQRVGGEMKDRKSFVSTAPPRP